MPLTFCFTWCRFSEEYLPIEQWNYFREVTIGSSSNIAKGWKRKECYPKNASLSQITGFTANDEIYLHYFSGPQEPGPQAVAALGPTAHPTQDWEFTVSKDE